MLDNLIETIKYHLHICMEKGCWKHGDDITPCYLPNYEVDEEGWRDKEPDFYYCAHHAKHAGFCICCGEFWAGIESFDFEHPGYCDNCHDQMEADFREWDDLDEDGYSMADGDAESELSNDEMDDLAEAEVKG